MIAILIAFGILSVVSFFWVRGISNMKKNHPDYKGEDFLNWDNKEKKDNYWDDNKIHTEGGF